MVNGGPTILGLCLVISSQKFVSFTTESDKIKFEFI